MSLSDMKIAGSGTIGAGEYDKISISGSGKIIGNVRCKNFSTAGAISGSGTIECEEKLSVSGSAKIDGDIKSDKIGISGTLKCGNIKCTTFKSAGLTKEDGNIEAEEFSSSGGIVVPGLINAEKVTIKISGSISIGCIGGNEIVIKQEKGRVTRLPLISKLFNSCGSGANIETIEGNTIAIEYVKTKSVTGTIVAIGEGCEIETVQYSGEIEISPNATVKNVIKM